MSEVETIFFGHWTQKAPIYSGYRVSPSEEAILHKRVMIRILDLYNFGDESIITNPMFKAIFSSVPVVMLWIDYM